MSNARCIAWVPMYATRRICSLYLLPYSEPIVAQ